jgi:hypothetical protein
MNVCFITCLSVLGPLGITGFQPLHRVKHKGPTGEKPVGPNTCKSCSQSRVGRKGFKSFLVCSQRTDAYPSALSVAVLRSTSEVCLPCTTHDARHASSKKIDPAKTPSTQSKILIYLSEPWRPFDLAQDMLCVPSASLKDMLCASHRCFRLHCSELVPKFPICLARLWLSVLTIRARTMPQPVLHSVNQEL